MMFEIKKEGGRVLTANPYELFCWHCRKKVKSINEQWYFFDADNKLYCRRCSVRDRPLKMWECNLPEGRHPKYQFWLIDRINYGDVKILSDDDAELLESLRNKNNND